MNWKSKITWAFVLYYTKSQYKRIFKNYFKDRFVKLTKSKRSYLIVLPVLVLSFIIAGASREYVLTEYFDKNISKNLSLFFSLLSFLLITIGLLLNNLKIKDSETFEIVFQRINYYLIVYLSVGLTAILLLLSSMQNVFSDLGMQNIHCLSVFYFILTVTLTTRLLTSLTSIINEKKLFKIIEDSFKRDMLFQLQRSVIYQEYKNEFGTLRFENDTIEFEFLKNKFHEYTKKGDISRLSRVCEVIIEIENHKYHLDKKNNLFNSEIFSTRHYLEAFKLAIERSDVEVIEALNTTIQSLLKNAIVNNDESLIIKLLHIHTQCYNYSIEMDRSGERNSRIIRLIVDFQIQTIPNLLIYLDVFEIKHRVYNTYLSQVSMFGFRAIHVNDYQTFKYYISQLQIFTTSSDLVSQLRNQMVRNNISHLGKSEEEINSIQLAENTFRLDIEVKKRHLILGFKAWLIHLYNNDFINEERLEQFYLTIEELSFSHLDPSLSPNEFQFLKYNLPIDYLGWGDFQTQERISGIIYITGTPEEWISFGYLLDLIRNKESLSIANLNNEYAGILRNWIVEIQDLLERDKAKWSKFLKLNDTTTIANRLHVSIQKLNHIEKEYISHSILNVLKLPLNAQFVSKVKSAVFEDLLLRRSLTLKWFSHFGNIEKGNSEGASIKRIIKLAGGRKAFVDEGEDYVVDGFAQDFSEYLKQLLFNLLFNKESSITGDIIDVIDSGIESLEDGGFSPSFIMMPFTSQYHRLPSSNNDFSFDREARPYSEFCNMWYRNIPVYFYDKRLSSNKIIVLDFKNATSMKTENSSIIDVNDFTINVDPISKEEIKLELDSHKDKWSETDSGIQLTEKEIVDRISSGVVVELNYNASIELNNSEALFIGEVTEQPEKEI